MIQSKAFTLIELIIVIVIIGLSVTFIGLNMRVARNIAAHDQLKIAFTEVLEHSILRGETLQCYVSSKDIKIFQFNQKKSSKPIKFSSLDQIWKKINAQKIDLILDSGKEVSLESKNDKWPIYFFPSGETSSAILKIYASEYTQILTLSSNGSIEIKQVKL